ncbi:MAG: thioredoxin family protein [Cyanobacteria bacterium P01_H01_bin.121]
MVMTPSTMLDLGTPAPAFELDAVVTGETISLQSFAGQDALLVMFICQHCPFVKHVEVQLAQLGRDYVAQPLGIVAISSNSIQTHPQDSPDQMKAQAERLGFTFPYCFDATQAIAKAYTAACTPDFFLFDRDQKLAYRGQLDDSRPGNGQPVTGQALRAAIDLLLAGQPLPTEQKPSIGCNIKWIPGQEPSYFGAA